MTRSIPKIISEHNLLFLHHQALLTGGEYIYSGQGTGIVGRNLLPPPFYPCPFGWFLSFRLLFATGYASIAASCLGVFCRRAPCGTRAGGGRVKIHCHCRNQFSQGASAFGRRRLRRPAAVSVSDLCPAIWVHGGWLWVCPSHGN